MLEILSKLRLKIQGAKNLRGENWRGQLLHAAENSLIQPSNQPQSLIKSFIHDQTEPRVISFCSSENILVSKNLKAFKDE